MLHLNKGQFFAPDFLASMAMLGFMLTIFFVSWNTIIEHQLTDQEERELYKDSQRTVKTLISSEGAPTNWTSENIEVIGFAKEENVLNETKIREFKKLNYQEQQSLLRAANFQIKIEDQHNNELYEIGQEIEGDKIYSINREAIIQNNQTQQRVNLGYIVWD